eukprot:3951907-Prymnesium_polylepis.1
MLAQRDIQLLVEREDAVEQLAHVRAAHEVARKPRAHLPLLELVSQHSTLARALQVDAALVRAQVANLPERMLLERAEHLLHRVGEVGRHACVVLEDERHVARRRLEPLPRLL